MSVFPRSSRLAAFALALLGVVAFSAPARADAGFRKWIDGFYSTAAKHGISRSTYNSILGGVSDPDPEVLEKARYQPEFVSEIWDYLDARITSYTIGRGHQLLSEYKRWLDLIERKYGVDREILLAIWSMESTYGRALEREDILHEVGRALATLAWADKRRSKYASSQLIAAMKIVQNGDVPARGLVGSWAGAMGHTQFIPTSYLAWAVDIDGDGKRNVWGSPADALASAANLLKKNGWRSGETWGYEVVLPAGFSTKYADRDGMTVADFQKLGIRRANGKPFPRSGDKAVLKLFAGTKGPAFLMLRNFYVLKRYNNADKYALAVGHLADRIAGYGPFAQDWPRGYRGLNEDERLEVQKRLLRIGLYDGELDGNIGSGTRKAIQDFQKRHGMKPDGFPSREVLDRLRRS